MSDPIPAANPDPVSEKGRTDRPSGMTTFVRNIGT